MNRNHLPDGCDLASGTSADCDQNGIPDSCEPDCDGDGKPDACEIASGEAQDCNGNGIPDACDLVPRNFGLSEGVRYAIGHLPSSIAYADFDGNALPDLAVANRGSASVSVFLNGGNGALRDPVSYPVQSSPSSVTAADLDGDGDLDLAVTNGGLFLNPSIFVSVLLNDGGGAMG